MSKKKKKKKKTAKKKNSKKKTKLTNKKDLFFSFPPNLLSSREIGMPQIGVSLQSLSYYARSTGVVLIQCLPPCGQAH